MFHFPRFSLLISNTSGTSLMHKMPLQSQKSTNTFQQKINLTKIRIMCRSDNHHFGLHRPDPLRLLTTNAFYLNLKLSASAFNNHFHSPLSDSLTLLYPPRINGCSLEINGSKIRPDLPAYVTLHRVVNADAAGSSVVFGSVEKIRVGEGVRFEVYIGEEKLLKGVFRRDKATGWRVDCTYVLEMEIDGLSVAEAEVCVAVEGGRMSEKVAVAGKRRRRRRVGFDWGLEEIPEEADEEEGAWDSSCECFTESESDGGEDREEDLTALEKAEMELEMEGVRWAVDVGIWVVCLGVGYLVSRASAKTLRRRKFLL